MTPLSGLFECCFAPTIFTVQQGRRLPSAETIVEQHGQTGTNPCNREHEYDLVNGIKVFQQKMENNQPHTAHVDHQNGHGRRTVSGSADGTCSHFHDSIQEVQSERGAAYFGALSLMISGSLENRRNTCSGRDQNSGTDRDRNPDHHKNGCPCPFLRPFHVPCPEVLSHESGVGSGRSPTGADTEILPLWCRMHRLPWNSPSEY